ncbi:sulfotransferase 1A2-like [Glandiceps talaboti]
MLRANLFKEDGSYNTDTYIYKGIKFPWMAPQSCIEAMESFEVRQDDVWLITFAKSGTSWLEDIVNQIHVRCGVLEKYDPNADNSPYVEFHVLDKPNHQILAEAPSPRLMTSHLQPCLLPPQLSEKKPKVIYVARNPKDVVVSFMYHINKVPVNEHYETFQDFVEDFKAGKLIFGEWPSHVLYWWKKRDEENVLFLKYEDMKKDLESAVRSIVTFLGHPLTDDVIREIARETSIEATKQRKIIPKSLLLKGFGIERKQSPFLRKGIIGDWKTTFTVAQNEDFDKWYNDVIGDSGLTFDFTCNS